LTTVTIGAMEAGLERLGEAAVAVLDRLPCGR
jgi:hypothetical protein